MVAAVGTLLAREGFGALGVNAVAREAEVDKVLIYRYFGSMDQLLEAYGREGGFWPDRTEMEAALQGVGNLPPAQRAAGLFKAYVLALRKRPLTLEIMAWETIAHNPLTAVLERVREEAFRDIFQAHSTAFQHAGIDIEAVAALLGAGINHLLVRSRNTALFGGVQIDAEAGWERLDAALDAIFAALLRGAKAP